MTRLTESNPLLIITEPTDHLPGGGRPPMIESPPFDPRVCRLTAVSHIAPCIAWLFRLRELGYANWRDRAETTNGVDPRQCVP